LLEVADGGFGMNPRLRGLGVAMTVLGVVLALFGGGLMLTIYTSFYTMIPTYTQTGAVTATLLVSVGVGLVVGGLLFMTGRRTETTR